MDSKKLPLWKMALLAAPDSFGVMPANFTPKLPPQKRKTDKIAENEEKPVKNEEKPTLYYTAIKTQQCIDEHLSFSESIATAYFRISENKGEKVFLQGNAFLAKTAKAVFEKNKNLFIEAHDDYPENLYETVLRLTEEYLSTKCDLPIVKTFEIEENSNDLKIIFAPESITEEQLKDATLLPLESIPCSSDFLAIGAEFFGFLEKKIPEDMMFLEKLYPLPMPECFITGIMENDKLGAYKDKKIYINHRLALDSLRNPTARFILLLAMLHEYGHFLDDVLHEREGMAGGDSDGEEGEDFACKIVEHCIAEDLKFADFIAPDPKGEELRFDIETKVSEYDEKQRLLNIHFGVMNSVKDTGNLELTSGEIVENVEFWGIDAKGSGHEDITKEAALELGFKFGGLNGQDLEEGCAWPDVPYAKDVHKTTTDYVNFAIIYGKHSILGGKYDGDLAYESHFGKNQHWHSMCPKEKGKTMTNEEVKAKIMQQLHEWYSDAAKLREKNGLFHIGKMLHTIQDSYCFSHCWRTFEEYKWSIWSFQGYEKQNSCLHSVADKSFVKNADGKKIQTVGYKKALEATKFILRCYKENSSWEKPYNYLNDTVYVIHPNRKSIIAGESHPGFEKSNKSNATEIEHLLHELSESTSSFA